MQIEWEQRTKGHTPPNGAPKRMVTLRIEGIALPTAVLDVHLDNGAPRFTLSGHTSPVWTEGRLVASLLDTEAINALVNGGPLRIWAGTERVLHLQPSNGAVPRGATVDPTALSWVAHGATLAPFHRLTFAQAFDATQKAWLRAPRPRR